MKVRRRSVVSGEWSEMEIEILPEQLKQFETVKNSKWLVPNLPEYQRRFLLSGMTIAEQKEAYGE